MWSNNRQIIEGILSDIDYVLTLPCSTQKKVLQSYTQAFKYAHGESRNFIKHTLASNHYNKGSNLLFSLLAFVISLAMQS
jgi:hypothetical protein